MTSGRRRRKRHFLSSLLLFLKRPIRLPLFIQRPLIEVPNILLVIYWEVILYQTVTSFKRLRPPFRRPFESLLSFLDPIKRLRNIKCDFFHF